MGKVRFAVQTIESNHIKNIGPTQTCCLLFFVSCFLFLALSSLICCDEMRLEGCKSALNV